MSWKSLVWLVCVWLLVSCARGGQATEEPMPPVAGEALRGTVVNLQRATEAGGVVQGSFTLGGQAEGSQFANASVSVRAETQIVQGAGGGSAGIEALQEGQRIELTTTGLVRESFPVQVDAARIVILSE